MNQIPFPYKVRKLRRSKNLRISISEEGSVLVTMPKSLPEKIGHAYVEEKKEWIMKKLENFQSQKSKEPAVSFAHGSTIPFMGDVLTLYILEKDIQNARAQVSSNDLLVKVPMGQLGNQKLVREAIVKEFKNHARAKIEEGVEEYNKHYNFKFNRIAIKDNKTNWGSCSTKKNLNFNWRLIFAPIDILDYVVVHELCHLKEHNHGENFWALIDETLPDYKRRKRWLKDNSSKLKI